MTLRRVRLTRAALALAKTAARRSPVQRAFWVASSRSSLEALFRARFQAIIEESHDFFFVVAPDGRITYRSPSVDHAAVDGKPPETLDDLLDMLSDPGMRDAARARFFDADGATDTLKVKVSTAVGERWVELQLNDQTANSAVRGIIITCRDITQQEELARELGEQATRDELTGLPNRRALNATARALFRDPRRQAALLMIDLDGFKGVNDTLGHPAGDQLLCEVARRLTESTRAGETLARLGGDEFAVLADGIRSPDAAMALGTRLHSALAQPLEIHGQYVAIGASIGIALPDPDAEDNDDLSNVLLRNADIALYEAKRLGRGRVVVFEPTMAEAAEIEARLLREVELGYERGEFYLVFQPLVSTDDSETVAFETLMRWQSPSLGPVAPATFIPIAERTGAIVRMGRWAITESCERLAGWARMDPSRQLSVSVNVSVQQLSDDDLPTFVAEVLQDTGIEPHQLQLEVTESTIARDPHTVIRPLQRLRDMGVRVALDDFGTGYSSMAQLQTLPVDCIKIDRAFIERIDFEGQGDSVLQAIVDLARALDVLVVAEGVEQQGQLDALLRQNVGMAQGYLFAKPLEPEQVSDFLVRRLGTDLPTGVDVHHGATGLPETGPRDVPE